MGRPRPRNDKAADDRQDRTTAFTPFADLTVDADDGAVIVHRATVWRSNFGTLCSPGG